jgi:predicted MFS family arabinose efflux permease
VVASFRLIDESRNPVAGGFDVPGAATGTAGLGALVFALVRANVWGWGSAQTLLVLAAAAVLLTTFVILQLRGRHPLVPPRLFRSRTLVGADVGMLIAGAGLFAVFFFLTLYMQDLLHYSPLKTGIAYLPLSILLVMSAGVGSRILGRVGARPILVTGFLLGAGGLALLARLSPTSGYLDLLPSLVLIGTGMGGAFVSVTSSAVAGVPQEDTGVASALLNASQQIGGSLGLAILTAVATARFDAVAPRVPTPAALASATTSSYAYAFIVGALLLVSAAVIGGLLLRPRPAEPRPVVESAVTPSPAAVVRQMTRCGCHG